MSRRGKNDGKKTKSKKSCKLTGKKDGRVWTTSPEEAYMKERLPDFEKAKKERDFSNFWPSLYAGYWDRFSIPAPKPADLLDEEPSSLYESDVPMDSGEEEAFAQTERGRLRAAEQQAHAKEQAQQLEKNKGLSPEARYEARFICNRRKQIYSWMFRHCADGPTSLRKKKKATLTILPALDSSATQDRPTRVNQETEVYLHLFRDHIMSVVDKRAIEEDFKGPPINLIRQVARELYNDEDEETRALVAANLSLQTERKIRDQEKKKNTALNAAEQVQCTPQDYQNFHYGKNPHGNTFGTAYQKYQTAVVKPYTECLRTVYSAEVRADRALPSGSAAPKISPPSLLEGATHAFDGSGTNSPVPYVAMDLPVPAGPTLPPSLSAPDAIPLASVAPDAPPNAAPTTPKRTVPSVPEPPISLAVPTSALRATREQGPLTSAPCPSPRLTRIAQKGSAPAEPDEARGTTTPAPPPRPKPRAAFKTALLVRANEEAVDAVMPDSVDSRGNFPAHHSSPPVTAHNLPSSLTSPPPINATSADALPTANDTSTLSPPTTSMSVPPAAAPESSATVTASVDAVTAISPPAPASTRPAKRRKPAPPEASPAKRTKRSVFQSRVAKDIALQEADKAAELAAKTAAKVAKAAAKATKVSQKDVGKGARGGGKGKAA
ncbi:hypothetical protein HWV62_18110 [Athelia sp. TMB]|nr:hypothetical protein HWV62_18110 [Athelia sp. TMB]